MHLQEQEDGSSSAFSPWPGWEMEDKRKDTQIQSCSLIYFALRYHKNVSLHSFSLRNIHSSLMCNLYFWCVCLQICAWNAAGFSRCCVLYLTALVHMVIKFRHKRLWMLKSWAKINVLEKLSKLDSICGEKWTFWIRAHFQTQSEEGSQSERSPANFCP